MADIFETLGTGQGYLKGGMLGFAKSGKTYTAMLLAIGIYKLFGCKSPIAMFDTESGSEYISNLVKELTGKELVGIRSRSFDMLVKATREIDDKKIEIFVVDSITHPWRELCDGYLRSVNEMRKRKNMSARNRLEFQDWNPIKSQWAKWADWYLNSRVHIIICGRAGNIYEFSRNEETGQRELKVVGTKMKTETEFGFEPSLLVEMEREKLENGKMAHIATVIGDRFGLIDGQSKEFIATGNKEKDLKAVMDFFMPHIQALKPGAHAPVNTEIQTKVNVDEEGRNEASRAKTEKEIFLEEIQAEINRAYPSQTTKEKSAKADICQRIFNTRSWTKITTLSNKTLKKGLEAIRTEIREILGENVADKGDYVCSNCGKSCEKPFETALEHKPYCPHCLSVNTLKSKTAEVLPKEQRYKCKYENCHKIWTGDQLEITDGVGCCPDCGYEVEEITENA